MKSDYGMWYLVELLIKFPIDWYLNLQTLIFEKFSKKIDDTTLTKNAKMGQKINFPICDMDR